MTGIILALDLLDGEEAIEVAEETKRWIDLIKVNYPLVLSSGIDIIKRLSKYKGVIADFKIADIPYTSSIVSKIAFEAGAFAVICHGFAGSDTLLAVKKVASEYGGEVYVVTELSSPGGEEFLQKASNSIARLARQLGCHGIIAPATRPERVKELKEIAKGLKVICPGVGVQGGRVESLKGIADYIIVGRSIYAAKNPEKEARRFYEILKGW
jgi:orotidine-5'-phosphate decarboxylase